jgi:outer membrane autotransporter protein
MIASMNNRSAIFIGNSILTGGVRNSGTINSAGGSAILLSSSNIAGAISNTGTINGDIQLASSSAVAGGITNSGTINGGISLEYSGVAGGITNSGAVLGAINVVYSSVDNGITNSDTGTITELYLSGSTVTNGISNAGTITGGSQEVTLYSSSVSGGIINLRGATISAKDTGIIVDSSSTVTGGIRNDGLISATGTLSGGSYVGGNAVVILGNVDSLENTGSITATDRGIILESSAQVTGSISNSGTISGGLHAIFIGSGASLAGGIDNTGLLDGHVQLNNSTLNLNGTTGRVTGSVNGTSASVVNVKGTFTTEDTFDVGSFNINNGGTLNMANGITARSGFVNNGKLSVAEGQTQTISGNYTQGGTGVFQTRVSDAASYGKLVVTGTADLTGGSNIDVNVIGSPVLANGTVLSSVLSASNLLTASTINVTDNSTLFNFSAAQNGNAIDLTTSAASSTGVSNAVTTSGNTAGTGAAAVFDSLIAQGGSGPAAMTPVITALGNLTTAQQVSDAISQTLPLMTAGMSQSMLNTLQGTNQVIQSRQDANLGRSSGDEFLGDRQFWFKPLGSWAKQNNRNGVAGYDADTYGMVFGVDGTLSDKSSIGGAFAYTSTKVDSSSDIARQHASIDGYQLAVYGAYQLDDRISITYQGDISKNQASGNRRIDFGGINTTANSDFSSWSTHIGAGIGKTMDLSAKTTFTPSIRADYTRLRTDNYTESGAGALNLRVSANTVEELIFGVDGSFSHAVSDSTSLVGNLGVGYDALGERASTTASYVGGGAVFATRGIDPSPWLMRGGLGIVMHNGPLVSVSARYDIEGRESFTNQTASVKVGIKF